MLKGLSTKIVNSGTLMSIANLVSKFGLIIIITPLLIEHLPTYQVTIWLLTISIGNFIQFLDLGFTPTFIRTISYSALSPRPSNPANNVNLSKSSLDSMQQQEHNFSEISNLIKKIYLILALLSILLVLILAFPVFSNLATTANDWKILILLATTTPIIVYGFQYGAIIQGLNHVALWQRTQMIFSILALLLAIISLLITSSLVIVVTMIQASLILATLVNSQIARNLSGNISSDTSPTQDSSYYFKRHIWAPSWRSGLGVICSAGLFQFSGILYASFAQANEAAQYLLAIQLIRGISAISQTAFYSRLPGLSRMYAMKDIQSFIDFSRAGMQLTYIIYLTIYSTLVITTLAIIPKSPYAEIFPDIRLILLLGTALLLERFGAMHLQLYSTTNHINWHKANGGAALITILLTFFFYRFFEIGIFSFPLGLLIANLIYYSPYCAHLSYRMFPIKLIKYEATNIIPALIFVAVISLISLLLS